MASLFLHPLEKSRRIVVGRRRGLRCPAAGRRGEYVHLEFPL